MYTTKAIQKLCWICQTGMHTCKKNAVVQLSNAADKASKVKMDIRPSSALARRQFVTPRSAVSLPKKKV